MSIPAVLADNVSIRTFTTVEDVIVGEGTRIDSNVLMAKGARIDECKIFHGAVVEQTRRI